MFGNAGRGWTATVCGGLLALGGAALVAEPLGAQRARPAAAQTSGPRLLRPGQSATDTLRAADPSFNPRGRFRVFRIDARADKRYVIAMEAADFDAYVWVARPVGVLTEELDSDDDGGGGTNARLRFRPPAAGSYYVVAQSLGSEDQHVGAFTLTVTETDPAPAPTARSIAVGERLMGALTDESARREEDDDQPYDLYTFRAKGQRLRIAMDAAGFDAYLHVLKVVGGVEEEVATDDDGGGGTNARVTLEADGEYRIIARSLSENGRGEYSLSISEAVEVTVQQRPISVGQTVRGELTSEDPELEEGGYFNEYVVTASAGDEFRITLRSTEFDAYLRWGAKEGTNFRTIAEDDDSGGDLNSQLTVRVSTSGTFVIRVSALGAGSAGPYELSFERVMR